MSGDDDKTKNVALLVIPKDDRSKLSVSDLKMKIGQGLPDDVKLQIFTFKKAQAC